MPSPEDTDSKNSQTPDPEGPASTGPEADGPSEAAEAPAEERAERPQEELRPLDIYTVLRFSIAQLEAVAWQMMGLQADPITNQTRKDIEQARVAIDGTSALVEKLLPHVQGQEARDYQSLLTDLRLNFVKQSGETEKGD